ncbi:hypothetical protein REPUB_Repub12eG0218100 [Reevesia pubescens]
MSVLYSSNFKFPDGELRKNQEFMDSSYYLQQNQQYNSGLTRAPSSFLENLVNRTSVTASGTGFQDYRDIRSSSPEMETFFMLSSNGSGNSDSHDMEYGEKSVKQEESMSISQHNGCSSSSEVMYAVHSLANGNTNTVSDANSVESSFGVSSSLELENPMPPKMANGNSSKLVRQSSSPVEFFSNLGVDDGFNVIREVSNFQVYKGTNDETTSTGRLYNNHISFSSGPSSCSRPMPRITEVENESLGVNGPDNGSFGNGNGSDGHFISNLRTDSWNNASLSDLKRARESDGDLFCGLSRSQTQDLGGDGCCREALAVSRLCPLQDSSKKRLRYSPTQHCREGAKNTD